MTTFNPCWLTSTVIDLVREMDNRFIRRANVGDLLANALLNAGCNDQKLIRRCRTLKNPPSELAGIIPASPTAAEKAIAVFSSKAGRKPQTLGECIGAARQTGAAKFNESDVALAYEIAKTLNIPTAGINAAAKKNRRLRDTDEVSFLRFRGRLREAAIERMIRNRLSGKDSRPLLVWAQGLFIGDCCKGKVLAGEQLQAWIKQARERNWSSTYPAAALPDIKENVIVRIRIEKESANA